MAVNNPLLVPVNVEAFVINTNVLQNKGVNIQRWKYAYPFLNDYTTPQPKAFTGANDLPGTGTMLHWTLPQIMRNGEQNAQGAVVFPCVPNRWLVVRYSGPAASRQAVAWVVQSDALGNSDSTTGGAPYITPNTQPNVTTLQPTYVGQLVGLSNWNEPNPPSLFLTAVAPGNNMFSSFQPYCQNVFSMYDPLSGVAEQDTLSYFVAGWYSDAAEDIIGSWQGSGTFDEFLAEALWQRAAPGDDTATWGIYHSMVWGLNWDLNGPVPTNAPQGNQVKMALGNTAIDALTALIDSQSQGNADVPTQLLEAFQYGLLPVYDQSDAAYELEQLIHSGWFGADYGGYAWEIADKPVDPAAGDPPVALSQEEYLAEQQWLVALNQAQESYDNAIQTLAEMQWNLYQTWWKYNNAQANGLTIPDYPAGTSEAQFQAALDPTNTDSLVYQVNAQQALIAQLATTIPTGATQDALQLATLNYAASQNLPATRILKQYARRPFQQAYNPVVLMQGLNNNTPLTPTVPLQCRFTDQVVTAFLYNSTPITLSVVQNVIPVPANMQSVPSPILNLLQEFFLLDPGNATMVAATALQSTDPNVIQQVAAAMYEGRNVSAGICPDLSLLTWAQPWQPLVMQWDIVWYPINHDNNGTPLWNFDGYDYSWDGTGFNTDGSTWEYQGMTFVTPQASFNFRARIEQFIRENPNDEAAQELATFIENIDDWDFLSQSLVGLTQMMNLRDPNPNVSASLDQQEYFTGTTLADLVGNSATYVPVPGSPQQQPFTPWPASGFQNWRAGQFLIRRLSVVDKFGQTCDLVTTQTQQTIIPVLAPSLQPRYPVLEQEGYRFIQLAPRILQPARLNLDFVSCADDNAVLGLSPAVNPICAWLLHNYLDGSIACYDNTGAMLGAVWIVTNPQQQQVVHWTPAPGSSYAKIGDLTADPDLNHLGSMLQSLQEIGPAAFNSLLETLDNAALTISDGQTTADKGMTLLAGRPIAMARLRLQFQLQGNVVTDPSWRFTFTPQPNPVTGWTFNVRLGESGQLSDGLVGYYYGSDYSRFYAANVPDNIAAPDYLLPIDTGASIALPFDGTTAAFVTVLMDPRSVVHATTGILPVIHIAIPQNFVGAAFANIDLTFQVGPLLTDSLLPSSDAVDSSALVVMPVPSLKNGVWCWQQYEAGAWVTYSISASGATAQFSNVAPIIREGVLRLTGAVPTTSPHTLIKK